VTVTHKAPSQPAHDDPQALFPEARRRRRRRWGIGIGLLAVVVTAFVILGSAISTPSRSYVRHVGLPRWEPVSGTTKAAPAVFVAGDGRGGVGVYSTATGELIRTLSPQGSGGPDQQVVLSGDRQSVYFAQPAGPCSGSILSAPGSGASAPVVVVSHPGTLALAPSPSPASNELAWVGLTCSPNGSGESATLYVSNVATHSTVDLGGFSGQSSDNEITWSSDGALLAVQSGSTVQVVDTTRPPYRSELSLKASSDCRLSNPAFFPHTDQLAVIRTCYSSTGILRTSAALVFNINAGRPVALIATAPPGSLLQGMSIDSTGQHVLLGVVNRSRQGAEDVQVEKGRLVTVSRGAPTDAQW
jgi:hypothetical protein